MMTLPPLGTAGIVGSASPHGLTRGRHVASQPRDAAAASPMAPHHASSAHPPGCGVARPSTRMSTPPLQPPYKTKRAFVDASQLLRDTVEGAISAANFGVHVQDYASDDAWLSSLGRSLRELGAINEATNRIAHAKQRQLAAASAQLAAQRAHELTHATAELAELRSRAAALDAENKTLKDQVDFLSNFPAAAEAMAEQKRGESRGKGGKGSAFLAAMRRAQVQTARAEAAAAIAGAAGAAVPRDKSIAMRSEHVQAREKAFAEREARLKALHAEELGRLLARIAEERRAFSYAHESRDALALERRKGEEKRLVLSHMEAEESRLREGQARAQAAAASEVLQETQAEAHTLRGELERSRMELNQAKAHHATLETKLAEADRLATTTAAELAAIKERQAALPESFRKRATPTSFRVRSRSLSDAPSDVAARDAHALGLAPVAVSIPMPAPAKPPATKPAKGAASEGQRVEQQQIDGVTVVPPSTPAPAEPTELS